MPRSAESAPHSSPKKPKPAEKTSSDAKTAKAIVEEERETDLISTSLTKMVLHSSTSQLKQEEPATAKKEAPVVSGPAPPSKTEAKTGDIKFNDNGEKLIKTCCFGWLTEVQKAKIDVFSFFPSLKPNEDCIDVLHCFVHCHPDKFLIGLYGENDFDKLSKTCTSCLNIEL